MTSETTSGSKPRNRRLQYSLRMLLLLIVAVAVFMAWLGWQLERSRPQREAIVWLVKHGATLQYRDDMFLHDSLPGGFRRWFPRPVVLVELPANASMDISALAGLQDLEILFIRNAQIDSLSPLGDLEKLTTLYVEDTRVSDFSPLAEVENLQVLGLENTEISELTPISKLVHLWYLELGSV